MVSQKKLDANRRNAKKSTGPVTDEGKHVASRNALKHGLTSDFVPVLPGENEAEFGAFHEAMIKDLKPRGILQRELVDDIAMIRWKQKRIPRLESFMMAREQIRRRDKWTDDHKYRPDNSWYELEDHPIQILSQDLKCQDSDFARVELYGQRLQRRLHALLRELRQLRKETGEEEMEGGELEVGSDNMARDTGLRPVPGNEVVEECTDGEHNSHGPEARVTDMLPDAPGRTEFGESAPARTEFEIRKNEPNRAAPVEPADWRNPKPGQWKEHDTPDQTGMMPPNETENPCAQS